MDLSSEEISAGLWEARHAAVARGRGQRSSGETRFVQPTSGCVSEKIFICFLFSKLRFREKYVVLVLHFLSFLRESISLPENRFVVGEYHSRFPCSPFKVLFQPHTSFSTFSFWLVQRDRFGVNNNRVWPDEFARAPW